MHAQPSILVALGHYNYRIHRGIVRYAGRFNWHLNCEMCVSGRLPRGWEGDGVITILTYRSDLLRFVRRMKVPVVDLSVIRDDVSLPRVAGDQYAIGRVGAEHFLERAFRHFAWCVSGDELLGGLRLRGFAETLAQNGLNCETWLWEPPTKRPSDLWRAKSRWLAQKLRAIPKPAAVFAFNDYEAANVLDGCAEAGVMVPDEVAVLGVDNNELVCECLRVPLSSVRHDLERLGYEGAALLHRLMLGQPALKQPLLISPNGVEARRSTDILAVNHEPCRQALMFIQKHLASNIGVADVAKASGISRRSLEDAFRKNLNRSIRGELGRARLAKVKELLVRTELTVADIAAATGFTTPQYLNLVFHQATGTTPRKFRSLGVLSRQVPAPGL